MAYIKFCVIAIETNLKDKSIYITFNKEADTDTLVFNNLTLAINNLQRSDVTLFDIFWSKDLKVVQLKLKDSPVVNQPYILRIQEDIKDLEGNNLDKSLIRNITFESSVTSDIKLKSPSDFEVLTESRFSWEEIGDNPVNSYRLQVSTDTAFSNLVTDILITDKTEITLGQPLQPTQYFFRMRAELDDNFGNWSNTRTFLVQKTTEFEDIRDEQQDLSVATEESIIENLVQEERTDLLICEQMPTNGITPLSFSFLFNENLDSSDIVISIVRSDL